jgi:hypothetical protein
VSLRRSSRQSQPSIILKDYITYSVQYPIQNYIFYNNISHKLYVFFNSLTKIEESINYEVAKLNLKWYKAMEEELHVLEKKNQTWELYILPKNNGTIEWYKAKLVVKGYT